MCGQDILCGISKDTIYLSHSIQIKMSGLYKVEIVRAFIFKSSKAFLKLPTSLRDPK